MWSLVLIFDGKSTDICYILSYGIMGAFYGAPMGPLKNGSLHHLKIAIKDFRHAIFLFKNFCGKKLSNFMFWIIGFVKFSEMGS